MIAGRLAVQRGYRPGQLTQAVAFFGEVSTGGLEERLMKPAHVV